MKYQQKENLKTCSCTYPYCSRKGICCECLKYHRERSELSACYFSADIEKVTIGQLKIFTNQKLN